MSVMKIAAIILSALIIASSPLPLSNSERNNTADQMEDEWRNLSPCDERAHLDGSDIVWFVQENTRTGELRYPDGKPGNGRHKRDVTNNPSRLWPNGIVHYAFDSKILSDTQKKNSVLGAMRHWEDKTCVRFVERTTESDYLFITRGSWSSRCCCSCVGFRGQQQDLVLAMDDCFNFETIVHEIGHAVGFFHEHNRVDRDKHLDIHWDNIMDHEESNYRELDEDYSTTLELPYDYYSVMHYDDTTFAKDRLRTFTTKGGYTVYNSELSPIDVMQARILYNCPANPENDPPKRVPPPPPKGASGLIHKGCYYTITGKSGIVSTTNFPNHYPSGECTWFFQGPEGYRGKIVFEQLQLDTSPKCGDKVEVYASGWIVGTSCPAYQGPYNKEIIVGNAIPFAMNVGEIKMTADTTVGNGRGFRVKYLFEDVNECESDMNKCAHKCVNTDGSFYCECPKGYYRPERNQFLCLDVNECAYENGGCSDKCNNTMGSHECRCPSNKVLSDDKKTCITPPECKVCSHDCEITSSGTKCTCPEGMKLGSNGRTCIITNRCLKGDHGCQHECVNIGHNGDYRCECKEGFTLNSDGRTCQDVDECQSNPCRSNLCVNTEGSFRCECHEGYVEQQRMGNLLFCTDENECDRNPCDQTCTNTRGSYLCGCTAGYRLNADRRTCSDIDECATPHHGCQRGCLNTIGSYTCTCPPGYKANAAGQCQDINECLGDHRCSQICTNTPGSYTCSCKAGFFMNRANECEDVDECSSKPCQDTCINTPGSYHCTCQSGYRILSNGQCEDINECSEGKHSCSHTCENTKGSYSCQCPAGYTLGPDRTTCNDINECERDSSICSNGICTNTDGSYTCSCPDGHMKSSDGTCVCGSHIKIEGKRDVNIPPGVKACRQHISAMERQVIKVDLSSVSLPPSSNCANYIEVRNGNSGDSVLILKYCGEGSSTVVSSSPDVIVSWHFTNTPSVSPGAVLLSVQTSKSIGRSGVVPLIAPLPVEFSNPNFPRMNSHADSTMWMLCTLPGKTIDIRFKYTDIRSTPSGDCKDNYIEIRDGFSPASPLLKKICHPESSIHVVSTGNMVRVSMVVQKPNPFWRGMHAVAKYVS